MTEPLDLDALNVRILDGGRQVGQSYGWWRRGSNSHGSDFRRRNPAPE